MRVVKLFGGLGPIWTGIIFSKQLPVFTSEKYWIILIFLQMQGLEENEYNLINYEVCKESLKFKVRFYV